ncbi:MAG TPA: glycosyl hydrolase [Candidatus Glassbacteria bacterium]|nr:glycosyl hydrolase [Candidatus Glassbacteria bacterium]
MLKIDEKISPADLLPAIGQLFELSGPKVLSIEQNWDSSQGTPVFTVRGRYTSLGWTEWTRGFQYGSALLQYDATGDERFLRAGLEGTRRHMSSQLTHTGVHDHGFNNVSTYGNLLRLHGESRLPAKLGGEAGERQFYELALKVSGAVQAARWTDLPGELGYIQSFNGPHSLFADTLRSLRALALAHLLGQVLMGERDRRISLLERLVRHAETTARLNVYFGAGRDSYDVRGRVAHESIFNINDGSYRCPSTQQGYSPYTTWTRGLAWVLLGFAEQLEFVSTLAEPAFDSLAAGELKGKSQFQARFLEAARATGEFYIAHTPVDGIPYWDTGAPGLTRLPGYLERPANPFNGYEPVDSSAAAIAAQGLLRLGHWLTRYGDPVEGRRYFNAGLTVARTLFAEPYLSTEESHQGLLLHSVYHRPNGWDYIPEGSAVPNGESSMWGDYHARELALYVKRLASDEPYLCFFGGIGR